MSKNRNVGATAAKTTVKDLKNKSLAEKRAALDAEEAAAKEAEVKKRAKIFMEGYKDLCQKTGMELVPSVKLIGKQISWDLAIGEKEK